MIITKNEDIAPFDIDSTLVLPYNQEHGAIVKILDPVTGGYIVQRRHDAMIRLVKEARQRGSYVLVWSRGGWEWAQNVIKALELEPYVHQIMSKPRASYDDTPVENWLKDRVYIEPGIEYKNTITKTKE